MRVLVTGGAGFIGSNFVRLCFAERPEWEITVVDSFSYAANRSSLADLPINLIEGSIADISVIDPAIKAADVVINFAAESHNDNSLDNPWPFVESNILGTYQILESCRRHNTRLHHISTDEVYGDFEVTSTDKFTELSRYNPSSPYSSTKASSDMLVKAWVRSFGVKATISNCSNNYGPYQHVEKFIPRQITNLIQGKPAKIYGAGSNIRDWIHVDDHNLAVIKIVEDGKLGETYLIGADGERSNLQVVQTLCRIMGLPEDSYEQVADRPGHDQRYAIDPTELTTELGWSPKYTSFEQGLENTVQWYLQNKDWWESNKATTEASYAAKGL